MTTYIPSNYLRRYTELPYLIQYLQTKKLVLPNPETWDDKNDTFYIKRYSEIKKFKSTYALCLTQAKETYHHWRIFAHGSSGICIEFHKDTFLKILDNHAEIHHNPVVYKRISELDETQPSTDELPFLKRIAFEDEKEYRLFVGSEISYSNSLFTFKVPFNVISRIILSPWLPNNVASEVMHFLKTIPGCNEIEVYQSTLIENEIWKNKAQLTA
nr:DUF2971 domain-containing protein [uncultured Tolumonas sp.]